MALDFVGVYSAQRNEARRAFGNSSLTRKGQENIFPYPNLEASYAKRLIQYWVENGEKLHSYITLGKSTLGIPDTAHKEQWLRNFAMLKGLDIYTINLGILPETSIKKIWDVLDQVVIPMRGLTETPTRWELMKESIGESLTGIGDIIPGWMKVAVVAGLGLYVYNTLK
jgi:hypothetical protein